MGCDARYVLRCETLLRDGLNCGKRLPRLRTGYAVGDEVVPDLEQLEGKLQLRVRGILPCHSHAQGLLEGRHVVVRGPGLHHRRSRGSRWLGRYVDLAKVPRGTIVTDVLPGLRLGDHRDVAMVVVAFLFGRLVGPPLPRLGAARA